MNILVLCTGNSARSIILESLFNKLGQGRVRAFSAGSRPSGAVHPMALALLAAHGHEVREPRSKSWDEFALSGAPLMDLVLTVCGNAANEACPVWPGAPLRGHWGVENPAAVDAALQEDAFDAVYQIQRKRAEAFLELPLESMATNDLRAEITRIGNL